MAGTQTLTAEQQALVERIRASTEPGAAGPSAPSPASSLMSGAPSSVASLPGSIPALSPGTPGLPAPNGPSAPATPSAPVGNSVLGLPRPAQPVPSIDPSAIGPAVAQFASDHAPDIAATVAEVAASARGLRSPALAATAGAAGLVTSAAQDLYLGKSNFEVARNALLEGGEQAFMSFGGEYTNELLGRGLRAGFSKATTQALAAEEILLDINQEVVESLIASGVAKEDVARLSMMLLPSEAGRAHLTDLMANVAENSIFGGQKIADYRDLRDLAVVQMQNFYIDQLGERVLPDELGKLLVGAAETGRQHHKSLVSNLHEAVAERAAELELRLTTAPAKKVLQKEHGILRELNNPKLLADDIKKLERQKLQLDPKDAADKERIAELNAEIRWLRTFLTPTATSNDVADLVLEVLNAPGSISWDAAKTWRTELGDIAFAATDINNPKSRYTASAKRVYHELTKAMEGAATGSGDDTFLRAWKEANEATVLYKDVADKAWLGSLVKKVEEQDAAADVYTALLAPRRRERLSKTIALIEAGADESPAARAQADRALSSLRAFFLEDNIAKHAARADLTKEPLETAAERLARESSGAPPPSRTSTTTSLNDAPEGPVDATKLHEKLFNPHKGGYGRTYLRELFTEEQINFYDRWLKALAHTQSKGRGTGSVGIQLMQFGAIAGLTEAAVPILVAPPLISRALTSKSFAQIIKTGKSSGAINALVGTPGRTAAAVGRAAGMGDVTRALVEQMVAEAGKDEIVTLNDRQAAQLRSGQIPKDLDIPWASWAQRGAKIAEAEAVESVESVEPSSPSSEPDVIRGFATGR